jgi:hypothetical protein
MRAKSLGIEGILTAEDWAELVEKHGGKCASCRGGKYLVIDHIIPLSRGGTNTKDNIQPLCVQCNSSKGNKLPEEWPGRVIPPEWVIDTERVERTAQAELLLVRSPKGMGK